MDTLSHGLWGGVAFGRRSRRDFWLSFAFGVAPDLLSFGVFTVDRLLRSGFSRPELGDVPVYVAPLYDVTHSFVTFAVAFAIVWAIRRKPLWAMLAWPLHIVLDIFTHSSDFFPTPFLWPLVDYRFDGVSWGTPAVFFTNWALLVAALALWRIQRRIRARNAERLRNL